MSLVGNLEDLGLGDIFQIIFLSRRSGILAIRGKAVEGKIFFKDGVVIAAYSMDASKKIINNNVQDTVFGLFVEEGNFDFELKDPSEEIQARESGSIFTVETGLNPQFLAMEGSRLLDESKVKKTAASPTPPPMPKVEPSPPTIAASTAVVPQSVVQPLQKRETVPPNKEEIPDRPVEDSFSPRSIWAEAGITEEAHIEPVVASPGLSLLKSMIFELQNPHSSSEITLLILRFASEIMNRAVLFIVKKNTIEGLGQFGVVLKQGDSNHRIKGIKIQLEEESIFKDIIMKKMNIKKRLEKTPVHEYLVRELGEKWPYETFLAPLLVRGRIAALLYGDNVPEEKPIGDTESLEIFLAQAGIAMERALLEKELSMKRKE